jgi:protein FrlC
MKLAFNTWAYSSFPVWVPAYPLEETIKRLARIGYDGIEIGAAAPHAYPAYLNAERRREIKQVLDDNNIVVSAMLPAPGGGPGHNVSSPLAEERRAAIEQYKEVAQLCADLGGKILLYVAGWQIFGTSRQQAWDWSRAALAEIAPVAADLGVTVAVEPTPTDSNLIESADDALELALAVGAPNVKTMFDTIHVYYRNEPATDYVYRLGAMLEYVHLSDVDRLAPGQGRGDFVGLIEALNDIGYNGWLSMEIGFNRRDVEPDKVARDAYQYIKPLIG